MLKNFFKADNYINPGKGKVLISEPLLNDYYFKRSIVIIAEHNAEGSLGFVINNLVDVKLSELIPDFPEFYANVSIGGPMSTDTLQFIHSLGNKIPGSVLINPGLYWGGDFIELTRLIKDNKVTKESVLFFLGYSGWSPDQLDDEIKSDAWIVTEMSAGNILKCRKKIWEETIISISEKHKAWANFPSDPDLN